MTSGCDDSRYVVQDGMAGDHIAWKREVHRCADLMQSAEVKEAQAHLGS